MNSSGNVLQEIYEKESTDNIIYSIREELMEAVMEEAYKIYIRKQTIRFLVQCVYDAFVKFISISFYYHPELPDANDPIWKPDEPISPSPKDTWACNAVPVRPRKLEKEEIEELVPTKLDECYWCREMRCICSQEEEIDIEKLLEQAPSPSEKELTMSAKQAKSDVRMDKVPKSDVKIDIAPTTIQFSSQSSQGSMGSVVATTISSMLFPQSATTDTTHRKMCSPVAFLSKRTKERSVSIVAKTKVPEPVQRGSQASVVGLPQIRIRTKFQSKPEELKKKKKK